MFSQLLWSFFSILWCTLFWVIQLNHFPSLPNFQITVSSFTPLLMGVVVAILYMAFDILLIVRHPDHEWMVGLCLQEKTSWG
jgi:hypothetical protein